MLHKIDTLILKVSGISAVIWATGYSFDFSLVKLPVFDADGYPIQRRGVTEYEGLYFLGMPWLHTVGQESCSALGMMQLTSLDVSPPERLRAFPSRCRPERGSNLDHRCDPVPRDCLFDSDHDGPASIEDQSQQWRSTLWNNATTEAKRAFS